jgi:shikimate kinase
LLKQRTGLLLFDTDELVTTKFGLSIPAIFAEQGEDVFREAEAEVVRRLRTEEPAIIVTGGGLVLSQENIDHLKSMGTVVWLTADAETLFERASRRGNRPLLQGENPRATFNELWLKRQPFYARAADFRVETTGLTHDEVGDRILAEVERRTHVRT